MQPHQDNKADGQKKAAAAWAVSTVGLKSTLTALPSLPNCALRPNKKFSACDLVRYASGLLKPCGKKTARIRISVCDFSTCFSAYAIANLKQCDIRSELMKVNGMTLLDERCQWTCQARVAMIECLLGSNSSSDESGHETDGTD